MAVVIFTVIENNNKKYYHSSKDQKLNYNYINNTDNKYYYYAIILGVFSTLYLFEDWYSVKAEENNNNTNLTEHLPYKVKELQERE